MSGYMRGSTRERLSTYLVDSLIVLMVAGPGFGYYVTSPDVPA